MAVRVGVAPGVPERNRYSARSGLLLCRRQPAAVGGPVGLFLGCSSSSNATTRTPASRALAIPSKAAASTRRRLVAASGRKHERRTTGHGRDPDARFRRSARARAIVRPVAATSVPAGRGSARASTRLRKPGSSASRFPTGALLSSYAARGVRRRASRCCVSSIPLGIAPTDLAPLQPGEAIVASRLLARSATLAEDASTPVFLLARVFAADDDAGVGAFVRHRSSFAGMVGPPGRLVCSRIGSASARKAIRLWPGY